ncbi:MAG TPA: replication initiation regulator SeqA [Verrucomicrobiae bacterium]
MNMNKQIEVEPDVYTYIVQNTSEIGESASSILRRLLHLPGTGTSKGETGTPPGSDLSPLGKLLASQEFLYARGVVGRFLAVLKWLHDRDPAAFAKVERITGRDRLYFAMKPETLEASGKSVNPKQIVGTQYWVITTTSTALKQEILTRVMQTLGYSRSDTAAATHAISP